jgi:hypothetical protein
MELFHFTKRRLIQISYLTVMPKHRMIRGILIGRDFGDQIEAKNLLKQRIDDVKSLYSIECYTYSVKNDKLIFSPLED